VSNVRPVGRYISNARTSPKPVVQVFCFANYEYKALTNRISFDLIGSRALEYSKNYSNKAKYDRAKNRLT